MPADISPDTQRGFLTLWPLSIDNLWQAQSTYTVADPVPAVPEPAGDYSLVLTSAGSWNNDESLIIQTQQAGNVPTSAFVWKKQSDTDYYGRDAGNMLAYWQVVQQGNTTSIDYILLDVVGLADGSSLALVQQRDPTVTNTRSIRVYKRTPDGQISSTTLYTQTISAPTLYGALAVLADGSVLAAYMRANTTNNTVQIQTARTYNNGSNWYVQSTNALPAIIDIAGTFGAGNTGYEVQKIRIAEAGGEILLTIGAWAHNTTPAATDVILQYSSTDKGGSFIFIAATDGTQAYWQHDLLSLDGTFFLFYISTGSQCNVLPLSTSTTPIDKALGFGSTYTVSSGLSIAGGLTNKHFTTGNLAAWADEDGRIYASLMDLVNNKSMFILQSDNAGKNWYYLGGNTASTIDAQYYNADDTSSKPTTTAGCSAAGRQQLWHNYETASHARDNGIHVFDLGGYASVNMPALVDYPKDYEFAPFRYTWVAYDTPDATAHYTKTGTGTITATATSAQFDTLNVQTAFVTSASFTTSNAEGVIIRTRCQPVSEGELNRGRGMQVQLIDYDVSVYIDTTGVAIYDEHASSQVASASVDTTGGVEILFAVANGTARGWYRVDTVAAKQWISIGSGSLTSGGPAASNVIRFGHLTSLPVSSGSMQTQWQEMHYSFGVFTGAQLAEGQANPEELVARNYPPRGKTAYIDSGTSISTIDGPAYEGENYTIAEDSLHPLRHIFYAASPTPRVTYRSASVVSGAVPQMQLAWHWDTTVEDNAPTDIGADALAVHLNNINFRTFSLHRYDVPSTSWQLLGSFDNSVGGLLNLEREGSSIRCTAGSSAVYLHHHECSDWYIIMISGETTVIRKIRTNTAGSFSADTNTKTAVIQLADVENTDPTTCTGYLVPNICTAVVHTTGNIGSAIRITVDSQQTAENYMQIGNMAIGPLLITQEYGRGRTIAFDAGIDISTSADGVQRTAELSKGIRTCRIAWTEGVDISDLYDNPAQPDYYTGTTAAGAQPLAAPSDAPTAMLGLARYCNGSKTPVVYLPALYRTASTTQMLNRWHNHIFCTLDGLMSIEHVVGSEFAGDGTGEVYRVGSVTMREII